MRDVRTVVVTVCAAALACHHAPVPAPPPRPATGVPRDLRLVPQVGHVPTAIAFNADGTLVASVGDGLLKVWSVSSGLLLQTWVTKDDHNVAFAPDGKSIVSMSGAMSTWSLEQLGDEASVRKEGSFHAAMSSPDGRHLALGMGDEHGKGTLTVMEGDKVAWSAETRAAVFAIAYAGDGKTIVSLDLKGVTRAWDAASGTPRWASEALAGNTSTAIASLGTIPAGQMVAFTPNDRYVVTCQRNLVVIRDAASGASMSTLAAPCTGVGFTADAALLKFAPSARNTGAWDLQSGESVWKLDARPPVDDDDEPTPDLVVGATSPDGKLVALSSSKGLQLWTAAGKLVRTLRDRRVPPIAACLSGDGAMAVDVRPDDRELAGGGSVEVWSLREARRTGQFHIGNPKYSGHLGGWNACTISPDNKEIIIPADAGFEIVELATGLARRIPSPAMTPSSIVFVPGRAEVVVGTEAGAYRLALADGQVLARYGDHPTVAVGVSADGARIATDTRSTAFHLDIGGAVTWYSTHANESTLLTWSAATGDVVRQDARATPVLRGDGSIAFDGDAVMLDHSKRTQTASSEIEIESDDRALVAGGRVVELGETLRTRDARSGAVVREIKVPRSVQQLVQLSSDGRLALLIDNTLMHVVRVDTGHTFTLASDGGEWLVYTEDGYFDSSRNAGAMLAAGRGLELYRIDQLALHGNRPDLILERLGNADPDAITFYRGRYLRRLKALGLDERSVRGDGLGGAPTATIGRAEVEGDHANVAFELTAHGGDLLAYELYVNGVALHGSGGIRASGAKLAATLQIPLAVGDNRIEVGALGASGVEALRPLRVLRRESAPADHHDLYFVGFGVSRYKNPDYALQYPSKDILDLAAVLGQAPGFDAVHISTFVDGQATVEAIRGAKRLLAKAGVDDTVVVFFAGHGLHARDANAEYYFATHEVNLDDLPHTAASFALIDSLLDGLATRRKLLLLDTCESGEVLADPGTVKMAAAGKLASRGLVRVKPAASAVHASVPIASPPTALAGDPKPRAYLAARDRFILADLARRTGAVVFASSRGEESSYESDEARNGLFTRALLDALTGPDADTDHDGALSTQELRAFVGRDVAARSQELQHPTIDVDNPFAGIALPLATARAADD